MTTALSSEFSIPTNRQVGADRRPDAQGEPCTYLCGNSLGLMSGRSRTLVEEELQVWSSRSVSCSTHYPQFITVARATFSGVLGHFSHPHQREWVDYASQCTPYFAELVGAHENEVACMGTLTSNLHLLMNSFYRPTAERFKILCEARAFPSDQYAFKSQALAHGLDPTETILEISPRPGEYALREQDILELLEKQGTSIALVIFSGVQYYTGQSFPIQRVSRKAKDLGCICGWDLAHAIGNVPMSLHDWDVDFAVWCTYKYLNGGPGSIGGLFIHDKWTGKETPKYAGWWGHDPVTRFQMPPIFSPISGAQGFQQSNPSVFASAPLLGSLQIFKEVGMMGPVRERSLLLTGHLHNLLVQSPYFIRLGEAGTIKRSGFTIITPDDPKDRAAQLSLLFFPSKLMKKVLKGLTSFGVIGDEREPDVIRLAPAPLYNTLKDCEEAVKCLDKVMGELL